MKKVIVLACILLCGCATKTATDGVVDSTTESLDALEHSLTKDCKTSAITSQINAIRSQVETISIACDMEKKELETKIRYKNILLGLSAIAIAFLLKKTLFH